MKRCPQCNRVESDDSLGFCRIDGTPLVSESLPLNTEAGTDGYALLAYYGGMSPPLALGFAAGGWQGFLREMTSKPRDGVSPYMAGIFLLELGEKEKAFAQFEKAFENREYQLRFIKLDPSVDPLRSDPRFKELARRMRLD